MSVQWLLELHALNEAGRFDEVVSCAAPLVKARPRDYALRLQYGRALLALGHLRRAKTQLSAAVKYSKRLAAWPWFYLAALHAREGKVEESKRALAHAVAIDARVAEAVETSGWFAAWRPPGKPARRRAKTR